MVDTLVLMNKLPIHRNLNTSFVSMSGLVRHLRNLGFIGSIQLELSSYEAEIEFAADGSIRAREQDHIADRLSFGDDALQRIIIRSKEAGGLIHVYKGLGSEKKSEGVFVDQAIADGARRMAAGLIGGTSPRKFEPMRTSTTAAAVAEAPIPKPDERLDVPTTENWTELLALISELMQTIDASLAKGNVNFAKLFRNACGFVSFDHPFLDPDSDVFAYADGYITVRQRLSAHDLISGITSALGRIMQRLGEDPYFGNVCHQTMHRIRVLANRRKLQFQTFGLGLELQKITGI